MQRAIWNDTRILLLNQPVGYLVTRCSRFLGRACHVPGVGYLVNDAEVARAVLTRPDCFSPSGPGGMGDFINQCFGRPVPTPFTLDGAAHTEQRRWLDRFFAGPGLTAAVHDVLAPECEAFAARLRRGPADVAVFASRAIARLVAWQVGIRPEGPDAARDLDRILELGQVLSSHIAVRGRTIPKRRLARLRGTLDELDAVTRNATAEAAPEGSILRAMVERGASQADRAALTATLLLAGTETVSSGFPRLVALLLDLGLWDRLRAHPEWLGSTIDEGMRLTIPSPIVLHGVVRDCEVAGVRFRAGRRIMVALRNVLRDPRLVEDPDTFRLDRVQPPAIKNLWFGGGPHYCLGARMAVEFYRVALAALLEVEGTPRVVGRRVSRGSSFPGYTRLTVELAGA